MENVDKKQKWGPFFNLLVKSKLPWKWYVLNLTTGLLLSTLTVKLPQLAGEIMQGNIFDKNIVTQYVALMVLLAIAGAVIPLFGIWINLNTDRNLQKTVWKKFMRMPMSFLNKLNPSSLTSRVTSDTASVSGAVSMFIGLATTTFSLVLILITVYNMNRQMVVAMSVLIPWGIIVSILPGRFMFRASNKIQSTYSEFTNFITERLANLRLIKSSGSEELEVKQGFEAAERQYKSNIYLAKVQLVTQPFISSTGSIIQAFVLIYGGILVSKNELQMGELITLYMYSNTLSSFAGMYIASYQQIKQSLCLAK